MLKVFLCILLKHFLPGFGLSVKMDKAGINPTKFQNECRNVLCLVFRDNLCLISKGEVKGGGGPMGIFCET